MSDKDLIEQHPEFSFPAQVDTNLREQDSEKEHIAGILNDLVWVWEHQVNIEARGAAMDKAIALLPSVREEQFNEAVVLVADVAGLSQNFWNALDIEALSDRAEDVLKALKKETP